MSHHSFTQRALRALRALRPLALILRKVTLTNANINWRDFYQLIIVDKAEGVFECAVNWCSCLLYTSPSPRD